MPSCRGLGNASASATFCQVAPRRFPRSGPRSAPKRCPRDEGRGRISAPRPSVKGRADAMTVAHVRWPRVRSSTAPPRPVRGSRRGWRARASVAPRLGPATPGGTRPPNPEGSTTTPPRRGGGSWGPPAVGAGLGTLITDGEGQGRTGVCGRVLFFTAGTWLAVDDGTASRGDSGTAQARPPSHGCRLPTKIDHMDRSVNSTQSDSAGARDRGGRRPMWSRSRRAS